MKMALGLKPRFFHKSSFNLTSNTEGVLYREGDEVHEMYFV